MERRKKSPPVLIGSLNAVATSVYMVSKPATASVMVDGGASSAPPVLVVGVDEIVNQAPVPSTSPSESTQLILIPAVSQGSAFPGSSPQHIPRLDSGITSNVGSAQVNAFYTNHLILCSFSLFIHVARKKRSCVQCCSFIHIYICIYMELFYFFLEFYE